MASITGAFSSALSSSYSSYVAPHITLRNAGLCTTAAFGVKLVCEAVACSGVFSGIPGASLVPEIITNPSVLTFIYNNSFYGLMAANFVYTVTNNQAVQKLQAQIKTQQQTIGAQAQTIQEKNNTIKKIQEANKTLNGLVAGLVTRQIPLPPVQGQESPEAPPPAILPRSDQVPAAVVLAADVEEVQAKQDAMQQPPQSDEQQQADVAVLPPTEEDRRAVTASKNDGEAKSSVVPLSLRRRKPITVRGGFSSSTYNESTHSMRRRSQREVLAFPRITVIAQNQIV